MILKFLVNRFREDTWEYVDNITTFQFKKLTKKEKEEAEKELTKCDRLNSVEETKRGNDSWTYIHYWVKEREGVNFLTNMPAYLLNNDGKTIERIY